MFIVEAIYSSPLSCCFNSEKDNPNIFSHSAMFTSYPACLTKISLAFEAYSIAEYA